MACACTTTRARLPDTDWPVPGRGLPATPLPGAAQVDTAGARFFLRRACAPGGPLVALSRRMPTMTKPDSLRRPFLSALALAMVACGAAVPTTPGSTNPTTPE